MKEKKIKSLAKENNLVYFLREMTNSPALSDYTPPLTEYSRVWNKHKGTLIDFGLFQELHPYQRWLHLFILKIFLWLSTALGYLHITIQIIYYFGELRLFKRL